MTKTSPVVHLEDPDARYHPYLGVGWYWIDPEYLARHYEGPARVTGPYADAQLAIAEYYAYCAAVRI
jgi:hypothetical protein